jgi:hypothetical protein
MYLANQLQKVVSNAKPSPEKCNPKNNRIAKANE